MRLINLLLLLSLCGLGAAQRQQHRKLQQLQPAASSSTNDAVGMGGGRRRVAQSAAAAAEEAQAVASTGPYIEARTSSELLRFLATLPDGIDEVRVPQDIVFVPGVDKPPTPISVFRNISIVGAPANPAVTHSRIDFNFVPTVIKLQPGVMLTLRRLEIVRTVSRISAHVDFMAASPGATLRLVDVIQRRLSCLPLDTNVANFRSLPRPQDWNASQQVGGGAAAWLPPNAHIAFVVW